MYALLWLLKQWLTLHTMNGLVGRIADETTILITRNTLRWTICYVGRFNNLCPNRSTRSPARLLTSLGRILQTAGILLPIPAATARTTATTTTRSTRTAATRTPRGTTTSGGTPRGTTRPVEVRWVAMVMFDLKG